MSDFSAVIRTASKNRRDVPYVAAEVPGERAKGHIKVKLVTRAIRFDDLDTGETVIPLGGKDLDVNHGMRERFAADIS
jgi:hypothetical protein